MFKLHTRLLLVFFIYILFISQNLFAKSPKINILVAQYEKSLEFVMPEGGIWNVGNINHGDILPGVVYKIEGQLNEPSQQKFHLMVATVDLIDDSKLMDISEKYQKLGFRTHTICVGETPNKSGLPDNRVIHIGIDCFDDKEKAEEKKSEYASKQIKTWIYIENIISSSGVLSLSNKKGIIAKANKTGFSLKSKNGTTLKKVEHSKGYSWHGFEDRLYNGNVIINFGFDNCIDCVENTELEDLIVGVVPSEISSKAPKAAMEAQAVAARGEILSKKGQRHVNSGYEYCAEQHCQVYKGYQKISAKIKENIEETSGIILMRKDKNKILDAVYSSNCGGHSSANQNIWIGEPNPHLQGVSDEKIKSKRNLTNEKEVAEYILHAPVSWCGIEGYEGASKYRWSKTIDEKAWSEIEKRADIGKIKDCKILKRDVSGRIFEMKLTGTKATKTFINELEIRQLFGSLRSSCFIAEYKKNKQGLITSAILHGAGFGHGVGMCQTGAQSMAGFGYQYQYILSHYFPNARFVKLY